MIGYPSVGAWALHVIRSSDAPAAGTASAATRGPARRPAERTRRHRGRRRHQGRAGRRDRGPRARRWRPATVPRHRRRGRRHCRRRREGSRGPLRISGCGRGRGNLAGGSSGGPRAGSLSVIVDDLDPFRMPTPDGGPTGRLTPSQVTEFRDTLRAAWPVLPPASAAEIAAIVRVIVPYRAPESGLVSTSSPQVFGTVAMSRQPDKYACAETLVHETQHLKLCALLDLVTLTRQDDGQRYYAPWRPDPRPVERPAPGCLRVPRRRRLLARAAAGRGRTGGAPAGPRGVRPLA